MFWFNFSPPRARLQLVKKDSTVSIAIIVVLALFALVFFRSRPEPKKSEKIEEELEVAVETPSPAPTQTAATPIAAGNLAAQIAASPAPSAAVTMTVDGKTVSVPASKPSSGLSESDLSLRKFSTEDGVAVIDGDIVIGAPVSGARSGTAVLPTLQLWPTRVIPYFIQPSLPNPNRIHEALQFFSGTAVTFVPYSDQEDVLVFQAATGTCKSYVGRIGGKQPLWISPGCGPSEIAHEVLHALGFTHEQNRFDRDRYIQIHPENIEADRLSNFERMPELFMQISGLDDFSYTSLMIYAPDVFSKNGRATMSSLNPGSVIQPGDRLDRSDITRLNRYYGNR